MVPIWQLRAFCEAACVEGLPQHCAEISRKENQYYMASITRDAQAHGIHREFGAVMGEGTMEKSCLVRITF